MPSVKTAATLRASVSRWHAFCTPLSVIDSAGRSPSSHLFFVSRGTVDRAAESRKNRKKSSAAKCSEASMNRDDEEVDCSALSPGGYFTAASSGGGFIEEEEKR